METYGSMEKREKTDFILEQVRLCMLKKDYIRAQIISKKISIKFFEDVENTDLKLRFYDLMIQLAQQNDDYFNICKHYQQLYSTFCSQSDESKWKLVLHLF